MKDKLNYRFFNSFIIKGTEEGKIYNELYEEYAKAQNIDINEKLLSNGYRKKKKYTKNNR